MLKEFPLRVMFLAFWAFVLFMALSPKPPTLPLDWMGDKVYHMAAFAVLTVFARLSFRQMSDLRILERMSFAGALIEVFQALPALHRDCDWRDWAADTIAIAVTLLAMRLIPRPNPMAVPAE
jgi:hypothetical protein